MLQSSLLAPSTGKLSLTNRACSCFCLESIKLGFVLNLQSVDFLPSPRAGTVSTLVITGDESCLSYHGPYLQQIGAVGDHGAVVRGLDLG